MNDLQNHLCACWAEPANRTAARALVDHYMERHAVGFMEAARETYRLRRNDRNRRELAQAVAMLREGSALRQQLRASIRSMVSPFYELYGCIVIVAGGRRPKGHAPPVTTNPPAAGAVGITVGARWVIREAAAIERSQAALIDSALGLVRRS